MAQEMLDAFCRPKDEWVIECGLALSLRTAEFFQIPRVGASFFVQNLEATSNQSQFMVKWCLGILDLLRGEPIHKGYLIYENIKNMVNVVQRACGHLCVINELCMRVGVPTYLDGEMIRPKLHINASAIKRLQHNHPTGETQQDQEENQVGNEEEIY